MLEAFFDETGTHDGADVTAVAGFIFDSKGLAKFESAWIQETDDLARPYHTVACVNGNRPFDTQLWPEPRRSALMNRLATLTADHMVAGFIVQAGKDAFQAALENGPTIRKFVESPYTLCLLATLSMVDDWAREQDIAEQIHFHFEAGANHERQTREFVRRIRQNPKAAAQFSAGRASWASKRDFAAFACADLLAWEWQRNVVKTPDVWSDRMQILGRNRRIYAQDLNSTVVSLWAAFNLFHDIYKD